MRTTVTLAEDVAAAVKGLRRSEGLGVSDAINRLARRGLTESTDPKPYVNKSYAMGQKMDVSNIGEVLGMLDEFESRDRADEHDPHG